MTFDVDRDLDAETRLVRSDIHDGQPVRVVLIRRVYPTSVDDLWEALTSPERLPRWFLPVSGELRLGGRYQFEGNAGGVVTACEPPRSLSATWEFGDAVSWITVRLRPADADGTLFELEHSAPAEGDLWDQFGPGAVGVGWDLALAAGLARHLASGEAVDPAAAAAWTASDDGRHFIQRSSEGWCAASIASGTDPTAATQAAERTLAFYTGAAAS